MLDRNSRVVRNMIKNSSGKGSPHKNEGKDGDVQVRSSNKGIFLFGKVGGRWYKTTPLTVSSAQVQKDGSVLENTRNKSGNGISLDSTGRVGINNHTGDSFFCINSGSNHEENITLKNSHIAHGMTDKYETDTFGVLGKSQNDAGGLRIIGLRDAGGSAAFAVNVKGYLGEAPTSAKSMGSSGSTGVINFEAAQKSSATIADCGGTTNLLTIKDNATTRFIFGADGDADADSGWTTISDNRVKQDQETIPYGLAEVLQLQPKVYNKYSGCFDGSGNVVLETATKRKQIGFIAQEVKAIIPEIVKNIDDTESFYSMDDGKLTAVLVKAIQELTTRVTVLEG